MKKYTLSLIVAGIFGVLAVLIVIKMPALVDVAFVLSALVSGFLVGKNNAQDGIDKIVK